MTCTSIVHASLRGFARGSLNSVPYVQVKADIAKAVASDLAPADRARPDPFYTPSIPGGGPRFGEIFYDFWISAKPCSAS